MSTGITISEVNNITSKKYGFYVYNHSKHSSYDNLPGVYGSQLCSFDGNALMEGNIPELPRNLNNQTAEGIAEILNKIFQKNHYWYRQGNINKFESKSLQIGNVRKGELVDTMPSEPFIYIIGNPVKETLNKETSKGCSNLTIAAAIVLAGIGIAFFGYQMS